VKLADAFRLSEQSDVDLVEIAPQAVPPVCRLMDYGKFKYQESKKAHDKTKITLRFRGREMAHQEIGMRMLERLRGDLDEVGSVEQMPKMEGRQMVMVLSPKKKK